MNTKAALRRPAKAPSAAPTNLYEVLRSAHRSPAWLASQMHLPEAIVVSW